MFPSVSFNIAIAIALEAALGLLTHSIVMLFSVPAVLIEIQSGSHCVETDIEHFVSSFN